MRFARLELVRYGGYADRALDFGDGRPDLHLIVGPNEAGKSTLLSAIEDFLFGFHGQSTQDWKFDYKDLRVRALVERDGARLDITRRKGNKNTLLGPGGAALPDDALAPFVGAFDRASFGRMFGLDHAKLRDGGRAILEGRDDAASALFQAGSGLASIGAQLKEMEKAADALFKPSASNPTVNALLRQKQELQKRVREATLGEGDLAELRQRQEAAAEKRNALVVEAEELGRQANLVERVTRTRAPLHRLAASRAELEAAGPLPLLPDNAGESLAEARSERATARELLAQHLDALETASQILAAIVLPERLLAEQARIEALDERRPAIEKSRSDLTRRLAELEAIELRLAEARVDAGLAAETPFPPDSWRRRAGRHLEDVRALASRAAKLTLDEGELAAERDTLDGKLAIAPEILDLDELRAAASDQPSDAEDQVRKAEATAARLLNKAETECKALPWPGSGKTLAEAPLPSVAEVAALAKLMEQARDERRQALKEAETAALDAASQQRRLAELSAGETLPTPEAVRLAREERDQALRDVRDRLARPRQDDDPAAGDRLAELIGTADGLADRRDADAKRVAEHTIAAASLAEAQARQAVAAVAAERWLKEQESAAARWASTIAGLPESLQPAGFESWRSERERVLKDFAEAADADATFQDLRARLEAGHSRLGLALAAAGAAAPDSLSMRRREAQAVLVRLDAASRSRAVLASRRDELDRQAERLARERQGVAELRDKIERETRSLCAEAGIAASAEALDRAVEALEVVAADIVKRTALTRQVEGISKDERAFEEDVVQLSAALGRARTVPATNAVRGYAHELREAIGGKQRAQRARADAERATTSTKEAERRLQAAQARIDALRESAGIVEEAELDSIIAAVAAAAASRRREAEALRELTEVGEGQSLTTLEAEAEALPPDEAAALRDSLATRRREIESEREAIGRSLAEAEAALERSASEAASAEAQQGVTETQSALAATSQRYVELAAGAAFLRWLIDRHRKTTQAPLLARAGDLIATVTDGAYTRLLIEHDDDRARIIAERADGDHIGVEGLSEGTRDQLYLALRLAALGVRGGPSTLPLICDDLLVTADDRRAAAMLAVLQAASETMQVLVFTHHGHLVEVARRAVGDDAFRLHALEPVRFAAAAE